MKLPKHVLHLDDETELDHGYIVTLRDGYTFKDEPDCGVRGFDTMAEVRQAIKLSNIIKTAAAEKSSAAV